MKIDIAEALVRKPEISDDKAPVVSVERGGRNSSAIRAAMAILGDLKELGYVDYDSIVLSKTCDVGTLHRRVIDIVYRVREDKKDEQEQ